MDAPKALKALLGNLSLFKVPVKHMLGSVLYKSVLETWNLVWSKRQKFLLRHVSYNSQKEAGKTNYLSGDHLDFCCSSITLQVTPVEVKKGLLKIHNVLGPDFVQTLAYIDKKTCFSPKTSISTLFLSVKSHWTLRLKDIKWLFYPFTLWQRASTSISIVFAKVWTKHCNLNKMYMKSSLIFFV